MLSLLLMLSLGTAQYGYAFYLKHSLQQAAYVGARAAIMPSSTDAQVTTAVNAQMSASGFGKVAVTITTSPTTVVGVTSGTYVTCTVSCTWRRCRNDPPATGFWRHPRQPRLHGGDDDGARIAKAKTRCVPEVRR